MPDPELPKRWRRLYAHVISLDAVCPGCGAMTATFKGKHNRAYDRRRALFRCHVCGGSWYVGVIFWPARGRRARPWDHTPTPGEALQLRELSAVTGEGLKGVERRPGETHERVRTQVNLRCTCGEGCPIHHPGGDDDHDLSQAHGASGDAGPGQARSEVPRDGMEAHMSRSPEFQNPHVDHVPTPERCHFCRAVLPDDWEDQGWHELRGSYREQTPDAVCCGPCWDAEVEDGAVGDDD